MNTPFRKPRPAVTTLPKATVFRALRPKLGGRPLPAAGGQPRRCTGARPNPFLAVGSRNSWGKSLEKALDFPSGALSGGPGGLSPPGLPGLLQLGLRAGVLQLLLAGLGVGLRHRFL